MKSVDDGQQGMKYNISITCGQRRLMIDGLILLMLAMMILLVKSFFVFTNFMNDEINQQFKVMI